MIYILLLCSTLIFLPNNHLSSLTSKRTFLSILILALLFSYVPITQKGIGTDYNSYVKIFSDDYYLNALLNRRGEAGNYFFISALRSLIDHPRFLFIAYGVLTSFLFSISIHIVSFLFTIPRLPIVILTFIVQTNLYHTQFSAIRQALSISFSNLFLLLLPLHLNIFLKLVLAFMATGFHNSGFLPISVGLFLFLFFKTASSVCLVPKINFYSLKLSFHRFLFNASSLRLASLLSILLPFILLFSASAILYHTSTLGGMFKIYNSNYNDYYSSGSVSIVNVISKCIYLPFLLHFLVHIRFYLEKLGRFMPKPVVFYYFALASLGFASFFFPLLGAAFYRLFHTFVFMSIIPTSLSIGYFSKSPIVLATSILCLLGYIVKVSIGLEVYGYDSFF